MELLKEQPDYYELLIQNMMKKYPQVYTKIKRLLYSEDKFKLLDRVTLAIVDYPKINNFRIARSDNSESMKGYGKSKRAKREQNIKQEDSSIYGLKTKIVYYFGFDY